MIDMWIWRGYVIKESRTEVGGTSGSASDWMVHASSNWFTTTARLIETISICDILIPWQEAMNNLLQFSYDFSNSQPFDCPLAFTIIHPGTSSERHHPSHLSLDEKTMRWSGVASGIGASLPHIVYYWWMNGITFTIYQYLKRYYWRGCRSMSSFCLCGRLWKGECELIQL